MTIIQQSIFETQICFMTILISKLLLNSLLQFERLCGLAVMTRDLEHIYLLQREFAKPVRSKYFKINVSKN